MDKGARGWLYRTANKNAWRVASWYSFDDLVQDGHACWATVQARYVRARPGVKHVGGARDKAHVMALFKATYTNHLHDLAKFKRQQIDGVTYDGTLTSSEQDDHAEMCRLVAEAPPLVRDAINAILSGRTRSQYRRRLNGTRETTQERLCRAIGTDPATTPDIRKEIYRYLTE